MTYEYTCLACQHEWEAEQRISEKPLTDCPKCHQASAKRVVSGGAGFILKGGGWYADGYGSKGTSSKSDSSSKDSSSSTSSSASDSSEKKDTKKAGETSSSGSDSTGKTAST